jgi:hypothetical protein
VKRDYPEEKYEKSEKIICQPVHSKKLLSNATTSEGAKVKIYLKNLNFAANPN